MEDIYDRSKWPPPDQNPLVQLLQSGSDWISNKALGEALELVNSTRSKSVTGHYKDILDALGDSETKMERLKHQGVEFGQPMRFFSRKALILIAMRSRTRNAAAFRDWMASRMAEVLTDG